MVRQEANLRLRFLQIARLCGLHLLSPEALVLMNEPTLLSYAEDAKLGPALHFVILELTAIRKQWPHIPPSNVPRRLTKIPFKPHEEERARFVRVVALIPNTPFPTGEFSLAAFLSMSTCAVARAIAPFDDSLRILFLTFRPDAKVQTC